MRARSGDMETRGAAPIETQTEDKLTHFANAETLRPKPHKRDVACELTSKVHVGAHVLERSPPMGGGRGGGRGDRGKRGGAKETRKGLRGRDARRTGRRKMEE